MKSQGAARLGVTVLVLVATACGAHDLPAAHPGGAGADSSARSAADADPPSVGVDPALPSGAVPSDAGSSPHAATDAPPSRSRGMPTRGPDGDQSSVLRNLPGSTQPGCVSVGDRQRDVASGDFAAGPFETARRGYRAGDLSRRVVRLYFIPVHSAEMPGLSLQVSDEAGSTVAVSQPHWADADEFRFYDAEVALPHPGQWRITASAGADRGCWVVRIG